MIYNHSIVRVIDNTGARLALCIKILRKAPRSRGAVGDVIICSIKHVLPNNRYKIKRGSIVKAVIVRDNKFIRRKDGTYVRFDKAACAILKQGPWIKNQPLGKNIVGPVSRELRNRGFMKFISKASIAI